MNSIIDIIFPEKSYPDTLFFALKRLRVAKLRFCKTLREEAIKDLNRVKVFVAHSKKEN